MTLYKRKSVKVGTLLAHTSEKSGLGCHQERKGENSDVPL